VSTVDLGLPIARSGVEGVPRLPEGSARQTKKEFTSASEVRWCPGCGDYAILAAVQGFLPELGLRRENIVCVSGIGCSSRFPYYLDTYGLHSIHGRAPAIATGLATSRPDLNVWVITGDGDALSIGGNHLIHALRRNVNLTILLFNNRIYGLTKGQYSPTSETGKVTKSTPGAPSTSRSTPSRSRSAPRRASSPDTRHDRKHLTACCGRPVEHRGSALVEIYQNCPIFNDGAFDVLKDRDEAQARLVHLEHGQPVVFGTPGAEKAVVRDGDGTLRVVEHGPGVTPVVHDASAADPPPRSRCHGSTTDPWPTCRSACSAACPGPTYDDGVRAQVSSAVEGAGGPASDGDLAALLAGSDTWQV
jgi:2-oxoglutarate ferredoxin oxidoreductase subunit beta